MPHLRLLIHKNSLGLLPKKGRGGGHNAPPPLDVSRGMSATEHAMAAVFADFLLQSIAQLLVPNLLQLHIPFSSHALQKNAVNPKIAQKHDYVNSQWKFFFSMNSYF